MKPIEALRILDQVTSQVNTTRQGHEQIFTALKTLDAFIAADQSQPLMEVPAELAEVKKI